MTGNGQLTRGTFIINDFLRNLLMTDLVHVDFSHTIKRGSKESSLPFIGEPIHSAYK